MPNSSQSAFIPQGPTIAVVATTPAPVGVQAPSATSQSGQYRVVNSGTTTVFLGVGPTSLAAQASAVAPIAGSPSSAIPLLPGAVEILSFGELAFFSGLSSAAATVYITPGSGV